LALAATLAGGAAVRVAAFAVLGAGALAMGTAAALRTRPVEARVVETAAHAVAAVALLMTAGSLVYAAAVSTLWGLVLGVRALWPAGPAQPRRIRVVAACGCELLAYWLVLVNQQVTVLEAYTVPLAGAALLAGWLAVRGRPGLRSWSAYA